MPKLIFPPKLKAGSKVALFAPSFRFDHKLFDQSIERLSSFFKLTPVFDDSIFNEHMYFAGSDERRANELFNFMTDPNTEALFLIRGGYGVTRFLPTLLKKLIKKKKTLKPKIVVGQSDLTPFLNFLYQELGWVCFHGPVLVGKAFREPEPIEEETFYRCLFSKSPLGIIQTSDMKSLNNGKARAPVVGGNICLLASSLGTPYEINTDGKILFLEEVTEAPYRVDRMLTQLLQAGKFNKIKGLLLGQMTKCLPTESTPGTSVEEAITSALSPLLKQRKIPIIYNFPAGHGSPQITFPLGTKIELTSSEKECKVHFLEPSVR